MDQAEKLRALVQNKTKNKLESKSFRVITVTSGKGGVGKSSFVINLAAALRLRGANVAILDADIGMANVDIMYGIKSKYSIYDIIFNKMSINDIIEITREGIKIIPGGSGLQDIIELKEEQREILLEEFSKISDVDILIVDTGAGISNFILDFVSVADELIVITTPEPTSLTDAYSLIKIIANKNSQNNINIVINKVKTILEARDTFEKLNKTVNIFLNKSLNYRGFLFEDIKVGQSIVEQRPYVLAYPKTEASLCMYKIASEILGQKQENKNSSIKELFTNLIKKMGRGV
ncbi:Flagellum site-determining protein YlxH [Caloramator mitchellensis]|uniref:Flagellum site-determining protein YlxH n=1 Tax=Caloramator mitchellensis TaxID=908809 RepID=A0A0R3JU50_CALMK|nr:MinD/ParA family protein [Caloramator mitchellensis]KRQ87041.1 Flagellum site-determining protein YlxH [Caloramator mitchellensis]